MVRCFRLYISPCVHVKVHKSLTRFTDSSIVIAHIQEQCKNEPNSAVAYWYFTFRDSDSQSVDQCLRSLVTNLCSKRKETPKALQEAYELANNGQLSPSTESLMKMLNSAIDGFEHVYNDLHFAREI